MTETGLLILTWVMTTALTVGIAIGVLLIEWNRERLRIWSFITAGVLILAFAAGITAVVVDLAGGITG